MSKYKHNVKWEEIPRTSVLWTFKINWGVLYVVRYGCLTESEMMVDQNRPRITFHQELQLAENSDLTEQLMQYILNRITDYSNEIADEDMLMLRLFAP